MNKENINTCVVRLRAKYIFQFYSFLDCTLNKALHCIQRCPPAPPSPHQVYFCSDAPRLGDVINKRQTRMATRTFEWKMSVFSRIIYI